MFVKKNKIPLLILLFLIILILFSFYKYYKSYFAYSSNYYKIKTECTDSLSNGECGKYFKNDEELQYYLTSADPGAKYERLDAITLTCQIIEESVFNILQLVAPLLIFIAVIGKIHPTIKSGMFKNQLTRMTYKDYIKQNLSSVFIIATIIPIALILVFLISMIVMKGDLTVSESIKYIGVYKEWKYNNFLIYGLSICIFQYLLSVFYGLIAMIIAYHNKNSLVAIILSYISYLAINFFLYLVIYCLVLNRILGFKNLTEYFNISGYLFFYEKVNLWMVFAIILIILACTSTVWYRFFKNKERVIMSNEKINV